MTPPGPLRADVRRLLDIFERQGVRPHEEIGLLEARRASRASARLQPPAPEVARVQDLLVPTDGGRVPVRIYDPAPGRPLPFVVYLHGGGWSIGDVLTSDQPCRSLARTADCVIASVDYRLAPETPFPGPLEDCVAATRWLLEHAPELGGRADATAILGDSAGGHLAAATVLRLRDAGHPLPDLQVLVYPVLALLDEERFASHRDNADAPIVSARTMQWFWDLYLSGAQPRSDDARQSPYDADLTGLPRTLVAVAELDLLRDEGIGFVDRLRQAGTPAELVSYPGAIHGFWGLGGLLEQAEELTQEIGRFLGQLH